MFDLSVSSILAGLLFSTLGWYVMKWGRKKANTWHIGLGFALLIYPYFVSGDYLPWVLGALLSAGVYVTR